VLQAAGDGLAQLAGVPSGPPSSKILLPSRSITLQCTCRPLPASSSKGLGMKLATRSCWAAISLMMRFIIRICRAASTGLSTCCMLISYCDGADSLTTPSKGRFWAWQAR
jgi:hypothetical protein